MDEHIKPWRVPVVENEQQQAQGDQTNALVKPRNWRYEPPEEEVELLPPTAEEIEAIRQAGHDEGFASGHQEGKEAGHAEGYQQGFEEGKLAGHQQGFDEGMAAAKVELDELRGRLKSLLDNLREPVRQVNRDVQDEIAILSTILAKAIIHVEVHHSTAALKNSIESAINALPVNDRTYRIMLHRDDLALVHELYSEVELSDKTWTFEEKAFEQRGGCEITNDNNTVDFSIAHRTREVIETFLTQQGLADDVRAS